MMYALENMRILKHSDEFVFSQMWTFQQVSGDFFLLLMSCLTHPLKINKLSMGSSITSNSTISLLPSWRINLCLSVTHYHRFFYRGFEGEWRSRLERIIKTVTTYTKFHLIPLSTSEISKIQLWNSRVYDKGEVYTHS